MWHLTLIVSIAFAAPSVWPVPASLQCTGIARGLSPNFNITASTSSSILAEAAARYTADLRAVAAQGDITGVQITVTGSDADVLSSETDYSHSLSLGPGASTITVSAASTFGAAAALETLYQLVQPTGRLPCTVLNVTDAPALPFRGLLVDVGRRFVPVAALFAIIDNMAYAKMNVLRLHISDFGAVRINAAAFAPTVPASRFYMPQDISSLVTYAYKRGIRVIPQVELPDHASGFAQLPGNSVTFCQAAKLKSALRTRLTGSAATSLAVTAYLQSILAFFPDAVFDIGGDLNGTATLGACTINDVTALQTAVVAFLESHGKSVAGWSDLVVSKVAVPNATLLFAPSVKANVSAAAQYSVLNATADGFWTVESGLQNDAGAPLTLSGKPGDKAPIALNATVPLYRDYTAQLSAAQKALYLGVSASFWTGQYCATNECGAWDNGKLPLAFWMEPAYNDAFAAKSIAAAIFPRAAAVAGAVWHFDATLAPNALLAALAAFNAAALSRNASACANACACNEVYACSAHKYSHQLPKETEFGAGIALALIIMVTFGTFVFTVLVQYRMSRTAGAEDNDERKALLQPAVQ